MGYKCCLCKFTDAAYAPTKASTSVKRYSCYVNGVDGIRPARIAVAPLLLGRQLPNAYREIAGGEDAGLSMNKVFAIVIDIVLNSLDFARQVRAVAAAGEHGCTDQQYRECCLHA